jgi:hypothetical protein
MTKPISLATVAALASTLLLGLPGAADAATHRATLRAPGSAIEGDRFSVSVRISSPKKAKRVEFQRLTKDILAGTKWTKLRSLPVRRHATRSISVLADGDPSARIRAVVTYTGTKKKAVSRPLTVNYWHWTPLARLARYASSGYVVDSEYVSFNMNGRSWKGWYDGGGSAESRYTLGRNCTRFKGYVGLTDRSADGSQGAVTLSVITSDSAMQTVWRSPALTAGSVVPVDIALASPYRFAIAGQNTGTPVDDRGTVPAAYPAVGDAQFLCHFSE